MQWTNFLRKGIIIDIGFHTTNFLLIECDPDQIELIKDYSSSIEIGVSTAIEKYQALYLDKKRKDVEYAVYVIPNKRITKHGLYTLQNDIKSVISAGYENVVIFYKHEEAVPYLQEDACGSQSYLLLLFTKYGMSVFDNCQEIYEYIEKTATERFGNCERAEYQVYDYVCRGDYVSRGNCKAGDKYIMVLVDNDIIKYKLLEIYSKRCPKEDQIVICTQDQKSRLEYFRRTHYNKGIGSQQDSENT